MPEPVPFIFYYYITLRRCILYSSTLFWFVAPAFVFIAPLLDAVVCQQAPFPHVDSSFGSATIIAVSLVFLLVYAL